MIAWAFEGSQQRHKGALFSQQGLTFPRGKASKSKHIDEGAMMIAYQVNDMTCGHCVSMITKAVQRIDPAAKVVIDLDSRRVEIGAVNAVASELKDAIEAAGYTPLEASPSTAPPAPTKAGGCCGCR
ncbi:MAG: heavy-metal-associated domain-containing protein [Roseateles sp.]|uniref:heavy-metal-associated domain-containing protein n=1 Tax=Roseateles sp. TaxID=1971397 RepID=UPI0040352BE6